MSRIAPAVLVLALAATPALAQTYVPGQSQARLNQFQLQMQSDQLQQLQRQNAPGLSSPNPGARMQALQRQQTVQQQLDQTSALAQQMQAPLADPNAVNARLQQNGDQIQQLQPPPAIPPIR